jgi:hypothetical protein
MAGLIAFSTQDKELKTKSFQDMPLDVVEVRHLQAERWYKDLEIEVKNVSDKPIYFILAYIIFPDDKAPNGDSGIPLVYGTAKNVDIGEFADPEDIHLDPGKTYVFTIPEDLRKGLEDRTQKYPGVHKKMVLKFALISFGDGTGFEVGEKRDLRWKKPTDPEGSKKEINSSQDL